MKRYCSYSSISWCSYSPLEEELNNETKITEKHGGKQVEASEPLESYDKESSSITNIISEKKPNPEILNKLKNIKEQEQKIDKAKIFHKR